MTTGCVVGEDRADQERRSGHPEDLLGDDRAAEGVGIWSATSVTTGISAFRTTCLTSVVLSESPFARAV